MNKYTFIMTVLSVLGFMMVMLAYVTEDKTDSIIFGIICCYFSLVGIIFKEPRK